MLYKTLSILMVLMLGMCGVEGSLPERSGMPKLGQYLTPDNLTSLIIEQDGPYENDLNTNAFSFYRKQDKPGAIYITVRYGKEDHEFEILNLSVSTKYNDPNLSYTNFQETLDGQKKTFPKLNMYAGMGRGQPMSFVAKSTQDNSFKLIYITPPYRFSKKPDQNSYKFFRQSYAAYYYLAVVNLTEKDMFNIYTFVTSVPKDKECTLSNKLILKNAYTGNIRGFRVAFTYDTGEKYTLITGELEDDYIFKGAGTGPATPQPQPLQPSKTTVNGEQQKDPKGTEVAESEEHKKHSEEMSTGINSGDDPSPSHSVGGTGGEADGEKTIQPTPAPGIQTLQTSRTSQGDE